MTLSGSGWAYRPISSTWPSPANVSTSSSARRRMKGSTASTRVADSPRVTGARSHRCRDPSLVRSAGVSFG